MLEPPHCLHTNLMRLCSQMLEPPHCFSLHPLLWRWCGHFTRFFFAASPLARLLLQVAALQLLCLAAFLGQGTLSPLHTLFFPFAFEDPLRVHGLFPPLGFKLLAPPPHLSHRTASCPPTPPLLPPRPPPRYRMPRESDVSQPLSRLKLRTASESHESKDVWFECTLISE